MDRYGMRQARPALRPAALRDVTDIAAEVRLLGVPQAVAESGRHGAGAERARAARQISPAADDRDLTDHALGYGAKGMAWIRIHGRTGRSTPS